MEVCITNQCKQRILENSISFQIKGYVFLKDTDQIISKSEDKKTLTLNDFITSNDTIIYNKDHSYFDTTYIPNLEVSNDDNYYFGSYNIKIDKGLDKESIEGFNDTFDAILVIGEDINVITDYDKNTYSITENNKTFLAAIITDSMGFNPNNTQSVTIHFAIGEEPISDNYDISNTFTNLNPEMKDLYTTKINDYLFLTPAPNYENAITGTIYYLSNVSITGNFFPSNISLADEFYKINNIWNVGNSAGTVNIFSKDGYNSKITTPQLMLTCSSCTDENTPTYDINSFIFKYSQTENSFLMGQDTGNKAIQVDILPEYFERLNISDATNYSLKMRDGFMTGVQQGATTSSWYGNISSTNKYFRLASINSIYYDSYDIFEIRSENSRISSCSGISLYGNNKFNDSNNLNYLTDSLFIDSTTTTSKSITNMNKLVEINSTKINSFQTTSPTAVPNNITFIGSDNVKTFIDIKGAIDNNTYIGKNDNTRNIYPLILSKYGSGSVVDLRKYPDNITTAAVSASITNIGNFASIGFENIALTRPYPLNDYQSVYSVVFGHDNSYSSPFIMRKDDDGQIFFSSKYDNYFNNDLTNYRKITADDGDYSLYKLVAVGNGKNNNIYDPHAPSEFASKGFSANIKDIYTLDLFSVEKDSFQLVNKNYEDGATIEYIPKLFAVRGHAPTFGKYIKRTVNDSETYEGIVGKYNLQNALYTPDKLYVPLPRSSNDVYEIDLIDVYKALKNIDNNKFTKLESSNFPDVEPIESSVKNIIRNRSNRIVLEDTPAIIDNIKEKYCEIFNITDETEKAKIFSDTDDTIYTVYLVDTVCVKKIIYRGDFINL